MDIKKKYHTIIIGTGCAGYNAADWLYDLGVRDIAVITEGINMGTSRNTGSDKQTYYKLTLAGGQPDSVHEMAQTLFNGGGVHGDLALAEAAGSARSFMKLVNLGLPFPANAYGEYVGYKTDHDPRQRATSCGPLTSRLMTEALEKSVLAKGVPVLDNRQVIRLLADGGQVYGLVSINTKDFSHETYECENIILAAGGPAGVYSDVVFPESQTGALGLAVLAGALMSNLNEWQYGLASTDFRWNVSGTYQQVLPRYISVGADGGEFEFLPEHFPAPQQALDNVFLKGYQWPFDSLKVNGSSQIDLIIARETKKGRAVYMDFRRNPRGLEDGFDKLGEEAYQYLKNSGALFGKPIDRLAHMNPKAIELYKNNGIDLYAEPLKVAVCAQHCNGGVAVDVNWESSVKGLYAVGEAAGTFGMYRPGGSALNSAQVGSMRAAEHIARKKKDGNKAAVTGTVIREQKKPEKRETGNAGIPGFTIPLEENQKRMSQCAAFERDLNEMKELYHDLQGQWKIIQDDRADLTLNDGTKLPAMYKRIDLLVTQMNVLSAMILAAEVFGSRGGAMVKNIHAASDKSKYIVTVNGVSGTGVSEVKEVRPLVLPNDWFETVYTGGAK